MLATLVDFPVCYEKKSDDLHIVTVDMGSHGTVALKVYKDLVGPKFEGQGGWLW